jgi:phosphatidylserine decarboxylase
MNRFKSFFMAWLFPWVPKRLLSRTVGVLMRIPLGPLSGVMVPVFASLFGIDSGAAEKKPRQYRSLDDFFTRRLKPGLRPISGDLVYPVDGRLTEQARIDKGELLQAKGWTYALDEFLGDRELALAYEGGHYFTCYLCPADYHRVHAPAAGDLTSARHIPGLLWPVNDWSVTNIRRLFNLNERVALNFTSPRGRWSLVMVGATNVGHMTVTLDPSIITNRWLWHAPTDRMYTPAPAVKAGDEVGIFHLGSTVVCLFEKSFGITSSSRFHPVRMGEALR